MQLTGTPVDASEFASVSLNYPERGRCSMRIRAASIWVLLLAGIGITIAAAQTSLGPGSGCACGGV